MNASAGGDVEAEEQMGPTAKRQRADDAETQPCSTPASASFSHRQSPLPVSSGERSIHFHKPRGLQQVSNSM